MSARFTLRLQGADAEKVARILGRRLVEVGADACPPGSEPDEDFRGVVIRLDEEDAGPADACAAVSPNDTPDFAAEKILDLLDEKGIISLESGGYTPEEEEAIRRRLTDLGYIE
jgi:hypothetical protein